MMFHMNQNLKVVLAVEPVDLRKSFNGLYAIARTGSMLCGVYGFTAAHQTGTNRSMSRHLRIRKKI
jgi:hypothetical protein